MNWITITAQYLQRRRSSFAAALAGIVSFVQREPHARIHLLATAAVIALAGWLRVSLHEAALLSIVTALVWITEMLNTAIEKAMDFISTERHPSIRFVKDVAAGAVLLAACVAVIVASFIFLPKIFAS